MNRIESQSGYLFGDPINEQNLKDFDETSVHDVDKKRISLENRYSEIDFESIENKLQEIQQLLKFQNENIYQVDFDLDSLRSLLNNLQTAENLRNELIDCIATEQSLLGNDSGKSNENYSKYIDEKAHDVRWKFNHVEDIENKFNKMINSYDFSNRVIAHDQKTMKSIEESISFYEKEIQRNKDSSIDEFKENYKALRYILDQSEALQNLKDNNKVEVVNNSLPALQKFIIQQAFLYLYDSELRQ